MSRPAPEQALAPRRQPIQQRSLERSEQLLDITARLLEDVGFDKLTTILIAREAGISVGTLYHYFPNKHAILYALGERWLDAITSSLEQLEQVAAAATDPQAFVNELLDRLLIVYRDQQGLLPLAQAMFAVPELRALDERHDQAVIATFASAFAVLGIDATAAERDRIGRALFELSHALLLVIVNQNRARGKRTLDDLRRLANALLSPYMPR